MHFVNWDELTDEEQKQISEMGSDGRTIVRERARDVVNRGFLKPGTVCSIVEDRISFRFSLYEHTTAYKHQKIRPESGCDHPERTVDQYCRYDEVNSNYVYTRAWAERLIEHCQTAAGFTEFVGVAPKPKPQKLVGEMNYDLVSGTGFDNGDNSESRIAS
jgi:hypothetical protein